MITEADETRAATCVHSKHPHSGCTSPRDLICPHGKGTGFHNLVWHDNIQGAMLSCNGCSHYREIGMPIESTADDFEVVTCAE